MNKIETKKERKKKEKRVKQREGEREKRREKQKEKIILIITRKPFFKNTLLYACKYR